MCCGIEVNDGGICLIVFGEGDGCDSLSCWRFNELLVVV